jgi:23S rRNA (pseudouridine1915-N3)-methyltransferase
MRISILSVGHKMPAWIQEGFQEYTRRMPPEIRVELVELKPEERSAAKPAPKAMQAEGERLIAAVPSGATVLALDEKGRSVSTQGLSVMLADWMRDGSHPAFVIGGADGLDPAVVAAAQGTLAFGPQTWPHALARAMLAEQVYRAVSILAGSPYHRD